MEKEERYKEVTRDGKKIKQLKCPEGYKALDGKCVKMTSLERQHRSDAAHRVKRNHGEVQHLIDKKRKDTMEKNKKITELKQIIKSIIKEVKDETYFETYSGALNYVYDKISKKFKIDEDDWFREINIGGKPRTDVTKRASITIYDKKTGKELRKKLQIQVYNMGNSFKKSYELNFYVS